MGVSTQQQYGASFSYERGLNSSTVQTFFQTLFVCFVENRFVERNILHLLYGLSNAVDEPSQRNIL